MAKIFKKIIFVSLILVTLFSILLWGLAKRFNPETLKPYLNQQITRLTHKPSKIVGGLKWSLFPRPGIEITQMMIGDPKNPSGYTLILGEVDLHLKLSQLFKGKLLLSEMKVKDFKLTFFNFNSSQSPDLNDKQISTSSQNAPIPLMIQRLILSQGTIEYQNHETQYSLTDIQIGSEEINLSNEPFPVQIRAKISHITKEHKYSSILNFKGKAAMLVKMIHQPNLLMDDLYLDGQLSLQDLTGAALKINSVLSNLTLKDGVLSLKPLTFKLYDGESVGHLVYTLKDQSFVLHQTATQLNAHDFAYDLIGKETIMGTSDLSLHLNGQFNANDKSSLNGDGNIIIKNGAFLNFNIQPVIDDLKNAILTLVTNLPKKLTALLTLDMFKDKEKNYLQGQTQFDLVSIPFTIHSPVIETQSLAIQAPAMLVKGLCQIDMSTRSMNGELHATLLNASGQDAKVQKIIGGNFPIKLGGTLDTPILTPDINLLNPILQQSLMNITIKVPVEIEEKVIGIFK